MTKEHNLRAIALDWIQEILEKGNLSHLVIRRGLEAYPDLDKRDRAFVTRLTEGTVERQIQLDYVIGQYASVKLNKMKPLIRSLLRMSVYQLLYMDSVPDSAVCNEAVKLAAKRGFSGLKGFVNGTLRHIAADKDKLSYPPSNTAEGLSIRYSMPLWIVEAWTDRYGFSQTEEMLQAVLKERPLMVHVTHKDGKDSRQVKASLEEQNIIVKEHPYLADAWMLESVDRLEKLEAFQKGWIQPQDISSQLSSHVAFQALNQLAAHSRKTENQTEAFQVLDVCGAPGGKSLYVADMARTYQIPAQILSRDLTKEKVAMIEENKNRLELTNMKCQVYNALIPEKERKGQVDVLIADLPCSGLGIMGRKNDIKYHVTPESQKELVQLQRNILDIVSQYVKPGGYLIYSTCTINPDENEENYQYLCRKTDFTAVDLTDWMPQAVAEQASRTKTGNTLKQGYLQLLPGIYDSDGFFLSACRKNPQTADRLENR